MYVQLKSLNTQHLQDLIAWMIKHSQGEKINFNYRFMLERLAPVVLGSKPSELLNISNKNYERWLEFKKLFRKCPDLDLKEIRSLNGRLQVLFYHKKKLNNLLANKNIREFLKGMKYPSDYDFESYIDSLVQRIKTSDHFPHEIGVFLGYPLKDVLGFMGIVALPYKRTLGWKVYGNEIISLHVFNQHSEARKVFKKLERQIYRQHNLKSTTG